MHGVITRTVLTGLDQGTHTEDSGELVYRTTYTLEMQVSTLQNDWQMKLENNKPQRRYNLECAAVLAELLKTAALVLDQGVHDALGGWK